MAWDRDLGDEPPPAWRDAAPDPLAQIDPDAPVSGHRRAPEGPAGPSHAPEQDWDAARVVLVPVLRPMGTMGTRLDTLDAERLASEGMKSHASPILDPGPCGLMVGYALRVSSFDVHVNADHLLAWGTTPDELRSVAAANLAQWSLSAPWTDEVSGNRRLLSSATGDGDDAVRILLPAVRAYLTKQFPPGARILLGIPERDLLVVGALSADDPEFAALFAEFVREASTDADHPLDGRVLELVAGQCQVFEW